MKWLSTRQPYQELRKRGLVNNFKRSVCTGCIRHAEKYFSVHRTLPSTGSRNGREEHSFFSASTSTQDLSASHFDDSTFDDSVLSENTEMADGDDDVDEDGVSRSQSASGAMISYIRELAASVQGLGTWGTMSGDLKDALCTLASSLGALISPDIYNDSVIIGNQVRNLSFGQSLIANEWLKARNQLLLAFLQSCTNICPEKDNVKKN